MSLFNPEWFTRDTDLCSVVTGQRILIKPEPCQSAAHLKIKLNEGGREGGREVSVVCARVSVWVCVCSEGVSSLKQEQRLHPPLKARLNNHCLRVADWAAWKGLSMSGLKTPAHIRFHTLILLVPTPHTFLYLSYLSLRWNIRLVARLWLYLITTLSNTEGLWASSQCAELRTHCLFFRKC